MVRVLEPAQIKLCITILRNEIQWIEVMFQNPVRLCKH